MIKNRRYVSPFFKLTNNLYSSCLTWNSTFFSQFDIKKYVCISPLNANDDYGFISSFILGLEKNYFSRFFLLSLNSLHVPTAQPSCQIILFNFFFMRSLLSRNWVFAQLFRSFAVFSTNKQSPKH